MLYGAAALLAAAGVGGYCLNKWRVIPALGSEYTGARKKRIESSPNWHDGAFRNLEPTVQNFDKGNPIVNWYKFFTENQENRTPKGPIPSVKTDLNNLKDGSLVWLGHSAFFLKVDGKNILIDPCLYNCFPVPGFFEPFKGSDIYKPEDIPHIDLLVYTHDHYDHLDMHTATAIRNRVDKVITPLGVGAHLEGWGYDPKIITELDWWDSTAFGNTKITATPSQHFSGRTFKRNQTLWSGFMFEFKNLNLYLSGDTGYGSHFKRVKQKWPQIDVCILEDGQYNEEWAGIHLLPRFWAKAVQELAPGAVIPSHNSKFNLSKHGWKDPMQSAEDLSNQDKLPVALPIIGEVVDLSSPWTSSEPGWWNKVSK